MFIIRILKDLFHYLFQFLALVGLRCCMWAFCSCSEWGLLSSCGAGLLNAVTSPVAETGSVVGGSGMLEHSSVVVAFWLSCPMACGIFPDQGSNPGLLYWQADSLPESPGKPYYPHFYK